MASYTVNPASLNFQKKAALAQMRSEANGRFAAKLRQIHVDHSLAEISDANMARYIELDPERSAARGLPVLMTKEQWKNIQPQLGTEPVNILFRRKGVLQGNVPPLAPRRPGGPSPGERERANAAARAEAARIEAAEAAVAAAAEWRKAVAKAASRGSVAVSRASNGSNGSNGAPGPPMPLLPRAPVGAVSSAAAAALQAGLGNYPNSPRAGDPAGAVSSSRAQSRLTVNTPAASFNDPSNGKRVMNMLTNASRSASRQHAIAVARARAATRVAASSGTGGSRKTRRHRKTRRQRK